MTEVELHEIKSPSGKKYFFRRMSLTEKVRYNRIALSRMRGEFQKIDADKEAVIFSAAMRNELQFVILTNTLMKADDLDEKTKIDESSIESIVDARDYEVLNEFLDSLNYPDRKTKKKSESSSGKTEEQETPK